MATKKRKTTTDKKSESSLKQGALLLSDGSLWRGYALGAKTSKVGECVFHTGHTGYQEILTDPSYCKQIMVFSFPEIGNQGFHEEDAESSRIWASGAIMRDYADPLYHWRKAHSLDEILKLNQTPGLFGVDTRRLILHLRENGNQWGVLSTETSDAKELKKYLSQRLSMEGLSLTEEVSTRSTYRWTEGSHALLKSLKRNSGGLKKVVVIDFGVKRQILRYLIDVGFEEVIVMNSKSTAEEILKQNPDAVFLSNGPGDPAAETVAIEQVKKLHGKLPILGICLGHQILALSLGMKTFKLKFGHHAANHPVMNSIRDHIEITSQNHGFAVRSDQAPKDLKITHINLNDQTVEGFVHSKLNIAAIQFHPESAPGPLDSREIFYEFQKGRFAA